MSDPTAAPDAVRDALLDAALAHVAFDGWSQATFRAAAADTGISGDLALSVCPRGALDLAAAFHRRGDDAMAARLGRTDLGDLRFRDRIAAAVRFRLEAADDREAVRRGATLFALPQNAPEGARLIWNTADRIWTELGDSSDDINWYTKRATLGAVYGATVLYWLGDDTPDHQATWSFLDRRIEDVMRIEKAKARMNDNTLLKRIFAGPVGALGRIKAPSRASRSDLPGRWLRPGG